MSPVSPLTDASLSPIEKILYSNLLSRQSASPVRTSAAPAEVERSVAGTPFETTDNSSLDSMMVSLIGLCFCWYECILTLTQVFFFFLFSLWLW